MEPLLAAILRWSRFRELRDSLRASRMERLLRRMPVRRRCITRFLPQGAVFADDSGLSVDALGGGPGVYSARFSGPSATDESNNQKLIGELRRLAASQPGVSGPLTEPVDAPPFKPFGPFRGFPAHYVCVVALAEGGNCLAVTEGQVEGVIVEDPRGNGGFGYDPYFFYPPLLKTFAEISADEKFGVSHRGIAFRKLVDYLSANRQAH